MLQSDLFFLKKKTTPTHTLKNKHLYDAIKFMDLENPISHVIKGV